MRERLEPIEEDLRQHDVLFGGDDIPKWAHFPHFARSTEEGTTVEVGIVGWEGFTSVQHLLLPRPGGANAVVRFAGIFMAHVSQHATCNRVHTIEQRLAKWLLTT